MHKLLRNREDYHHKKKQAYAMSFTYFEEVSSGIYYIQKDRQGIFSDEYVSPKSVAKQMESIRPTAIELRDGTVIMNRHLSLKL